MVVFPFVPVTPSIVIASAGSRNARAAIGPIASRTERTSTWGAATSSQRSTTSAAAPASSAARAKSCPSAVAPCTQQNKAPVPTARES